jgi:predicted membrane channel-forming protein YqfA (hemolysin III family)
MNEWSYSFTLSYAFAAGNFTFATIERTHNNKNRIHSNAYSIVKPTRCTISQIYFILEQHSTCF